MPHIKLEYSSNITQPIDFSHLFSQIHETLVEVAGININNCKSRAVLREDFYVGDGEPSHAFVHLEIGALEGRTMAVKKSVNDQALAVLETHFKSALESTALQLSVEYRDIERGSYSKFPGGTLSALP